MSFMVPEVDRCHYYSVDTIEGTVIIPADVCGLVESIGDLIEYLPAGRVRKVVLDYDDYFVWNEHYKGRDKAVSRYLYRLRREPNRCKRNTIKRQIRRLWSMDIVRRYPVAPTLHEGWLYRLSAPGYLDSTEWSVAETEAEAYAQLLEYYGTDDGSHRESWEYDAMVKAGTHAWCEECGCVMIPKGHTVCKTCHKLLGL